MPGKDNNTGVQPAKGFSGRSPSYPAFDLATAIEKLRQFYAAQKTNAVCVEAALGSLGYTNAKSGNAQRSIAALLSFGLLSEEGSGPQKKVRVSELGRKILLLAEGDEDRAAALEEAAIRPRIYREMLARWPESLPSDSEIRKFLACDRGYNVEATRNLIKDFRATYEFAKLGSHGLANENTSDKNREDPDRSSSETLAASFLNLTADRRFSSAATDKRERETSPSASRLRTLTIPITGDREAMLQLTGAMTERDIEFIQRYLELMKEAIITDEDKRLLTNMAARPLVIHTGPAIWRTKDFDRPVTVTGYVGERNGRHFISIEGSSTGIPLDEVEFRSPTERE